MPNKNSCSVSQSHLRVLDGMQVREENSAGAQKTGWREGAGIGVEDSQDGSQGC